MNDKTPNEPNSLPDQVFKIRPYRGDAYGESILQFAKSADEANEMRATKARVDIARLVAWAGVLIVFLITAVSLWIFLTGDGRRLEEATRFLILVMGGVLGVIFRPPNSNDG
jgi:hypothetical protein